MADEEIIEDGEGENRVEKRIKDLSDKVKLTAGERDEFKKVSDQKEADNQTLKKENEFLSSFGDVVGKHPEAASYRDAIKEKVLKGYTVEDATVSTLISEGKFTQKKEVARMPAGGSAVNQPVTGGERKISELTREEKRAKLIDAEASGDLSVS